MTTEKSTAPNVTPKPAPVASCAAPAGLGSAVDQANTRCIKREGRQCAYRRREPRSAQPQTDDHAFCPGYGACDCRDGNTGNNHGRGARLKAGTALVARTSRRPAQGQGNPSSLTRSFRGCPGQFSTNPQLFALSPFAFSVSFASSCAMALARRGRALHRHGGTFGRESRGCRRSRDDGHRPRARESASTRPTTQPALADATTAVVTG